MGYLVKDVSGKYVVRYGVGCDTDEVIGVVPEGSELCFLNDCDEDGLYVFAKEEDGVVFINHEEQSGWSETQWKGLSDIRSYFGNTVVWECEESNTNQTTVDDVQAIGTPIKSDGGSSDYYKRTIPKLVLERWNKDGYIEAKDVMKLFLGNDYNFSNSFKAHCRVQSLRDGVGKDGASEKYDLKKAWFFGEDAYNDYLERKE